MEENYKEPTRIVLQHRLFSSPNILNVCQICYCSVPDSNIQSRALHIQHTHLLTDTTSQLYIITLLAMAQPQPHSKFFKLLFLLLTGVKESYE